MFFVISLSTGRIFLRLQVGADQMVHLIEFSDGMLTLMKDQIIVSGLRIFIQCVFSLIKSLQCVSCKDSCIQFTESKQSDKDQTGWKEYLSS